MMDELVEKVRYTNTHKVAHYIRARYPDVAGCLAQYANT